MFVAFIFKPSLLKGNDIVQRVPETCLLEGSWSWGSSQSSSLMAPLLAEFHRIHVFFFSESIFGVFFCFWGVWCFRSFGGKKMVESMLNAFFYPNHWNLVFCEKKHSRKVFIFQFLLGESGEAPEMKSHVWKLRFCSLKLGEKNRGTSQGLTAKGETSCEIKGTA